MKGSGLEDKISAMSWPWLDWAWASRLVVLRIALENMAQTIYFNVQCDMCHTIPRPLNAGGPEKCNLHFGKPDVPQNTHVPKFIMY